MIAALLLWLVLRLAAPNNARNTTHGGRFYIWGRGERYWSVTTILKALPKDALKFWAAKQVAEFAVDRSKTWFTMNRDEAVDWLKREPLRFTNERAGFGTAVHAAAEAYAIKKPIRGDFDEEERKAIGHFMAWLNLWGVEFLAVEASVYNRTQKYAGTLDAIIRVQLSRLQELYGPALIPWEPRPGNGYVDLLVDYKTGGDVDEGKGVYPEAALQLAAYGNAEFMGMPNGTEAPLPTLDGALVLQVQAAGWRAVPANALDPKVFKSFLFTREVFRWLEETSKEVLGTPLLPLPEHGLADTRPVAEPIVDDTREVAR